MKLLAIVKNDLELHLSGNILYFHLYCELGGIIVDIFINDYLFGIRVETYWKYALYMVEEIKSW